jgi:hypothetical protein
MVKLVRMAFAPALVASSFDSSSGMPWGVASEVVHGKVDNFGNLLNSTARDARKGADLVGGP